MQIKKTLLAALLAASSSLSAAAPTGDQAVNVKQSIEVDTEAGKVLVRLAIDNQGEDTIYVPREVATAKELFRRRFDIREAGTGAPVDYTGRMVKRGPFTAADYLAVAPHTRHLNTIDITGTYAFKPGRHTYELRYEGDWLADVAKLGETSASAPVSVEFSYTGR